MPCRACGDAVTQFLDLGRQPLSDAFRSPDDVSDEFWLHLKAVVCHGCHVVQLADPVPVERMFHEEYPFRTSSSRRMSSHFAATAERLVAGLAAPDPFVVEIGSNDGTMLATIADRGIRHLGIDPAANMVGEALARKVNARAEWFDAVTADRVRDEFGPADVVYAANTMCHIPDLPGVFTGLETLLADDGIVVFEDPYLGDVLRLGSFDQIYDEHFYLFSATSVARIAELHGFALVDVEHLEVHGGELRYTLARDGRTPSPAVGALIAQEGRERTHELPRLAAFAAEVADRRDRLRDVLDGERAAGRSVAGYAATAKSATVLNYCGIGPELLPVVYDTTPEKQGRLTPGSHIPVEPFPQDLADYPDTFLLFAWNHAEEILAKEQQFVDRGGRWIRYVPDVRLG
ncbi:class I SAM-dependent methyltransferase [Micromonospora craniellae]|uniref:Class I SAM-dependent methyltransferase n=1 Tax=Micromonospora craniellae TaxID=2294034 RepID=A0A372FSJ3_9ACTN|nr:class I SAM-dependent methyltransferase [Micromonospora craniellae]QOC91742.1 class I SAM-dependent methyltransferase [Micromonospora craniellae]RFS43762.1 class I SAM-dependent methyltransferase [Micromonospora craniellae]